MNTFNKLKEIETVSRRSRPRSNHTQKINSQCSRRASVSTVWLHKPRHRIISITKCDTSRLLLGNRYHFPANIVSTKLPLQDLLNLPLAKSSCKSRSCFSEDLQKHHQSFCLKWIKPLTFTFQWEFWKFTIISDQSDIIEITGFITASDRFRMLIWFSSEIAGALFSATFLCRVVLHLHFRRLIGSPCPKDSTWS